MGRLIRIESDGFSYIEEGQFAANKLNGFGRRIWGKGKIFIGVWKNGQWDKGKYDEFRHFYSQI